MASVETPHLHPPQEDDENQPPDLSLPRTEATTTKLLTSPSTSKQRVNPNHNIHFGTFTYSPSSDGNSKETKIDQPISSNQHSYLKDFPPLSIYNSVSKSFQSTTPVHSNLLKVSNFVTDVSKDRLMNKAQEDIAFKPISCFKGQPAVLFTSKDKQQLLNRLHYVLLGKFSHGRPSMFIIKSFFTKLKLQGSYNLSLLDSKHLVIECVSKLDFNMLWLNLNWNIHGFHMRMFKWEADFNPRKESPIAPVWVTFTGLPIYMFEEKALLSLSNAIGTPIKIDPANVKRVNLSAASVCVELDVSKEVIDSVWVNFEEANSKQMLDGFWVKVWYGEVPPYCNICSHIGHDREICKRRIELDLAVEHSVDGGHRLEGLVECRQQVETPLDAAAPLQTKVSTQETTQVCNKEVEDEFLTSSSSAREVFENAILVEDLTLEEGEIGGEDNFLLLNQGQGELIEGEQVEKLASFGETKHKGNDAALVPDAGDLLPYIEISTVEYATAEPEAAVNPLLRTVVQGPAITPTVQVELVEQGKQAGVVDAGDDGAAIESDGAGKAAAQELFLQQFEMVDAAGHQADAESQGTAVIDCDVFMSSAATSSVVAISVDPCEPCAPDTTPSVAGMQASHEVQEEQESSDVERAVEDEDVDGVKTVVVADVYAGAEMIYEVQKQVDEGLITVTPRVEIGAGRRTVQSDMLARNDGIEEKSSTTGSFRSKIVTVTECVNEGAEKLNAGKTTQDLTSSLSMFKERMHRLTGKERYLAKEKEKDAQIRIVSQLSMTEMEYFAQQEIYKIFATPTSVAPAFDDDIPSISNPHFLDKDGKPVSCYEIIEKSPRFLERTLYQYPNNEKLIARWVKNGKYVESIKDVRKSFLESIRLTFQDFQQTLKEQEWTPAKRSGRNRNRAKENMVAPHARRK